MIEHCLTCVNFRNAPTALEAALPGLNSLSSANNASRGDDGLCRKHERFVGPTAHCADYSAALSMLSWMPHSFLPVPAQRPERRSAPGATRAEQV